MISFDDWREIARLISKQIAQQTGRWVSQEVVTKVDEKKRILWTPTYGDTAIPLVGHAQEGKLYYNDSDGTSDVTRTVKFKSKPAMPKVGDLVIVVCLLGSRRLPRCVGVIQADPADFVETDGED